MQDSAAPVDRDEETSVYRVYPQRFWILFVFGFLTFNQCMFWLTFSPIASSTQSYYKISEATVDLLLNWGPIIFLPSLPLTYLLLNTRRGLRVCVITFAIVSLIATLIRLIPSLTTSPSSPRFHAFAMPFIHTGQILIAATGPFAMALGSQLSSVWFAPHERTRATTVAVLSASAGGAIAFLISPHLVFESWRVPHLLYLHAGQALVACIFTLSYFPAEPPTPSSAAAHLQRTEQLQKEQFVDTLKRFARDILHCCKDPSCVLLVLAGGILGGVLSAWSGLFATILGPLGYSDSKAGKTLHRLPS